MDNAILSLDAGFCSIKNADLINEGVERRLWLNSSSVFQLGPA